MSETQPTSLLQRFKLTFSDPVLEAAWRAKRDDDAREPVRKGMIAFAAILLLGGLGDVWQAYNAWEQVLWIRALVWAPLLVGGAYLAGHPRLRGRALDITTGVAVLITLSLLALMVFVMPRSTAIDFPMYWTVLLIVVHVVTPVGFRRSLIAGSVVIGSFLVTMSIHRAPQVAMAAHTTFLLFSWALLIAASWLLDSQYRQTFLAERALTASKDDAERVLRAILPAGVARRLISGERAIVDEIDDATVLFADVVGFTELARPLPATDVVAFLDKLFTRFEELTLLHGADKVKTIGDGYMAVAGTNGGDPDHAERMAALALDLLQAVAEHARATGTEVRLRVGLHRGPLVAGILGRSRFSYDLWGDTVNIASRMESQGEPGTVQVSDAVARSLTAGFRLRPRGTVTLKGVGPVETWWLDSRL